MGLKIEENYGFICRVVRIFLAGFFILFAGGFLFLCFAIVCGVLLVEEGVRINLRGEETSGWEVWGWFLITLILMREVCALILSFFL